MEGIVLALGLSMHSGLEGDYNSVHPHVRFVEDGTIAGAYYNSVDRLSLYTGQRMEFGSFGAEFALVTGYPAFGPVAPFVRATYDLGDNVRAFASPAVENYSDDGIEKGFVFGIELMLK